MQTKLEVKSPPTGYRSRSPRVHLLCSARMSRPSHLLGLTVLPLLVSGAAIGFAQQPTDLFAAARAMSGTEVLVPPRALAVIPERNTGRRLRMIDTLDRIDPQFDDLARGAGLNSQTAIQLITREANVPIFVAKSDSTVSTMLQLEIGQPLEVVGVLFERGGRYLFVASEVRQSSTQRRRPPR